MKAIRLYVIALLLPLGLFAVLVLVAFLIYPTEYAMRPLRWGESDVYIIRNSPATRSNPLRSPTTTRPAR